MQTNVLFNLQPIEFKSIIIDAINACLDARQSEMQRQDLRHPKTVKEAASFLHLSVPTIYSLTSSKLINFHKKGKRVYFYEEDLLAYINSGRQKTITELNVEADKVLRSPRGKKNS
jgi:excisionase family DNA binding protein